MGALLLRELRARAIPSQVVVLEQSAWVVAGLLALASAVRAVFGVVEHFQRAALQLAATMPWGAQDAL